jgi:SAM-dependent methyltransferase
VLKRLPRTASVVRSTAIAGRYARLTVLDAVDVGLRRRPPLTPPRRKNFVGSGEFRAVGQEFLGHFIELGSLRPHESVLDIGCGIGRMAVPLTSYLSGRGSYRGFDIVEDGIRWCERNVSPRFPNFQFALVEAQNPTYRKDAPVRASEITFPYPAATFDFAAATSVFTHMLPADVMHYLAEINRVVRPGGRAFLTYFLIDEVTDRLQAEGRTAVAFEEGNGYRISDSLRPLEGAVGYLEQDARAMLRNAGLELVEPVHHGRWSGRGEGKSYQDIVIAAKPRQQ